MPIHYARKTPTDLGSAHKDALIQNHRKMQDQEWYAVQQKRKDRNERIKTYREKENVAFAAFRYEAEVQETVSTHHLPTISTVLIY